MKGDFIFGILNAIGDTVINTTDVFSVISNSGYGASYGKLEREISKRRGERSSKIVENEIRRENKQKYYNLVSYLKKSDLIKEELKSNKKFFSLTSKGKEKLYLLKNKEKLPNASYKKEDNNKFTIVIFDVPEEKRRKRDWLRFALNNLGFSMIQKSVWMGKVKIPKIFVDDLLKLKIVDCVEIFEISKTGSLEKII